MALILSLPPLPCDGEIVPFAPQTPKGGDLSNFTAGKAEFANLYL